MIRLFLLLIGTIGLFSMCKPFGFVKYGQFVDGVDRYFNPVEQENIWLYYNFQNYKGGNEGLRMDSLFSEDIFVLKHLGLKGLRTKVFFSAVSAVEHKRYHMLLLKHRFNNVSYSDYKQVKDSAAIYYFKDFQKDSLQIRHVVIPFDKNKRISLAFYVNAKQWADPIIKNVEYLSTINAMALQSSEPYDPSWQIYDCLEEKQIPVQLFLKKELMTKHKTVFFQLFAIYEQDLGLMYTKIWTKGSPKSLALKLCPNLYQLRYTTPAGQVLLQDTLRVGN